MERFWSKVNKTENCWVWCAACEDGYPIFRFEGRSTRAKRVAYILIFGDVPANQIVASVCRNKLCVNPAHLALTSHANMQISDPAKRFWAKVNKTDTCWLWTAAINEKGYGDFYVNRGLHTMAHRFSWILHHKSIPDGLFVCHRCDIPLCVNPDHLFLGTTQDNTADMNKKGRYRYGRVLGSQQPGAILTEQLVVIIRERYANGGITRKALATEYGVSQTAMRNILTRHTWKHV